MTTTMVQRTTRIPLHVTESDCHTLCRC